MYIKNFKRAVTMSLAATLLLTSVAFASGNGNGIGNGKNDKSSTDLSSTTVQTQETVQTQDKGKSTTDSANKKSGLTVSNNGNKIEIDVDDMQDAKAELANELKAAKNTDQKSVTDSVYGTEDKDSSAGLNKIVQRLEAIKEPTSKDLLKLSLSYKALGDNEKSIEYAQKAVAEDPDSQKSLIIMEQVYKSANETDKAIEELNKILAANPDAKVKAFMAILKEDKGELDEAAALLTDAVKDDTKETELYRKLGQIKEQLGDHGLKVYVKGKTPDFDAKPTIVNDRTVVPIRAISEALDAKVDYVAETRTVIITKGDIKIELPIGENVALVNGKEYTLETPSLIINDRTMVPLRFVSEALNTEVLWQGDTSTVIINEK